MMKTLFHHEKCYVPTCVIKTHLQYTNDDDITIHSFLKPALTAFCPKLKNGRCGTLLHRFAHPHTLLSLLTAKGTLA
jgi:hypothetical protein